MLHEASLKQAGDRLLADVELGNVFPLFHVKNFEGLAFVRAQFHRQGPRKVLDRKPRGWSEAGVDPRPDVLAQPALMVSIYKLRNNQSIVVIETCADICIHGLGRYACA